MATYTNINGDMSVLKSLLDSSGYFDSVTYDDTSGEVITCYVGQLAMLTITKTLGTGTNKGYSWAVQGAAPSWTNTVSPTGAPSNEPRKAYQCTGGLYLWLSNQNESTVYRMVITKNNNNVTTIAFSSSVNSKTVSQYGAIAATDTESFTTLTANNAEGKQTILIPACSCAGLGSLSYTTTVKITTYKQSSVFGFIEYNNKRYLYDGYFAVEDTPSNNSGGGAS